MSAKRAIRHVGVKPAHKTLNAIDRRWPVAAAREGYTPANRGAACAGDRIGEVKTMITALVQFDLPFGTTVAEASELFRQSAPEFRAMPGLIRKYCMFGEHGQVIAACLWDSREAAEQSFNAEWRRRFGQRYGMEPTVTYFATPVVVDNALGVIEGDVEDRPFGKASHGNGDSVAMASAPNPPVRVRG
jgi:hypothetical protein